MPGRSLQIGRIAGIPIGVSPWWLVIVAFITWSLGADYYPSVVSGIAPLASYALGLGSVLMLFGSILAHELGHALVARRHGVEIEEIDLWLLGGVARMRGQPDDPGGELRFALAGPAVTAAVAAVFGAVALALPASAPPGLRALVDYQAEVNVLILGFNLLPAFPLDGGRVARALLWRRRGDLRTATQTAARLGRGFGFGLIWLGVVLWFEGVITGLWFAVIGGFLVTAAAAERVQEEVVAALTGVTVGDLMSYGVVSVPAELTLADARRYFELYRFTAFPVVDDVGRAVGLLALDRLEHASRYVQLVGEVADRDPALLVSAHDDVALLLHRPGFARVGRAVVIDWSGGPVGLISLTDIQRAIRAARLRDPSGFKESA